MVGRRCCAAGLADQQVSPTGFAFVPMLTETAIGQQFQPGAGRLPTASSVNTRVMERVLAVLRTVARMPDAAPRVCGGTELMMEAVLGAANRPMPAPMTARRMAKTG